MFHFDHPSKIHRILPTHDRSVFLQNFRCVHVSCNVYTEENLALVLQLAQANPCGVHLCGMGSITDRTTQRTQVPSRRTTLKAWLLGASRSLSDGAAVSCAEEDRDPELLELVVRHLLGSPADESTRPCRSSGSPADESTLHCCLQACTVDSDDHNCSRIRSIASRWHEYCRIRRITSRRKLRGVSVRAEHRMLLERRRRRQRASTGAIG